MNLEEIFNDDDRLKRYKAAFDVAHVEHESKQPKNIGSIMPQVLERYELKALPTIYHGIQFRSRLEARWAVFYDLLNIAWDYEPEGFDLNGLWYLPDFWLPKQEYWIEIKGSKPIEVETQKAQALADLSDKPVFIFPGGFNSFPMSATAHLPHGWDCDYSWCQCPDCNSYGITFEGRSDRLPCKTRFGGECKPGPHGDKTRTYDSGFLTAAYGISRGWRFTR